MGRSRRILKKYYSKKNSSENILSIEFLLLKRIFFKAVYAFKFPSRS